MQRRPLLIYDPHCRICSSAQKMLSRWDRSHQILFLPYQERDQYLDAMRFIDADGQEWKGIEAFRSMLPSLPLGRLVSWVFCLPGVLPVAKKFYGWLARNRYRLCGRRRQGHSSLPRTLC